MPGIDMKQLDTVLKEARRFKPAPAFRKSAGAERLERVEKTLSA